MTNAEQEQKQAPSTPSEFGEILAKQRQQKGLSIGEISERLKLPARQIEALEKGNYEELPEPIFIRGFLRSYARFLDLDETCIDDYLAKWHPPTQSYHAQNKHDKINYANSTIKRPFPSWIFGLFAVIAIGYAIYAWQNKSQHENAKQANSTTITALNTESSKPSNLENANILVKPMTEEDSTSTTNATDKSPSSTGTEELVINTRYRTMLTVTNGKGEVLINQIVPARSEHHFSEGAPFEVRLGYAIGSTATFDGISIDIEKARNGHKTATFTASKDTIANIQKIANNEVASATEQ